MKKILSIAVASLAVAAVADTTFSPQIGVTTLDLGQKNNIIPVQFTSLAGGGNVTADALVCTNNIPNGSYLYVFTDNSYKAWYLLAGTGWVAPDVETVGKVSGDLGAGIPSADGVTLNAGSAIWLSFPPAESYSARVSVYGKVASSTNTTVAVGASDAPKSTLICNPTSSSVALADKVSSLSLAKGDTIQPLGATFSGNYVYSGSSWTKIEEGKITQNATLPSLGQYAGCWFVSKGGSGKIDW